jgi:hypothetical protein
MPVAYIWLERIWERPQSGHLFEGQGLRMGEEHTRAMEQQPPHPYGQNHQPHLATIHALLGHIFRGRGLNGWDIEVDEVSDDDDDEEMEGGDGESDEEG